MNRRLNKFLFLILEKFRREPVLEFLLEMKDHDRLKRSVLQEIQRQKTLTLLKHSYKNSEYYRELFDQHSIDVEHWDTLDAINKIPLLTKDMLRENLAKIRVKNNSKYTVAKTSGSTGKVLKFIKDREATAVHNALYFRGMYWHGLDIGLKEAMLWGVPVNKWGEIKIRFRDFVLNRFREKEYNLQPENMYDFYNKLKKKKPDLLSGYSSMIYQFAKFLKENNLNARGIGLKAVKCTSETVTDDSFSLVEEVFGCPLVVEYGAAETSILAFSCEYGNIHLFIDYALVEYKDHHNKNINPAYKELVVTFLHNYSLPIIRYKIGDYAIPKEGVCKCGRELPMVEKIIGRTSSLVYGTDGSKFHSIIFYYIFKGLQDAKKGGVSQFQVIQQAQNKLIINIVKNNLFSEQTLVYLEEKIKEKLGQDMNIDFKLVPIIKREPSGKLRDFISELN